MLENLPVLVGGSVRKRLLFQSLHRQEINFTIPGPRVWYAESKRFSATVLYQQLSGAWSWVQTSWGEPGPLTIDVGAVLSQELQGMRVVGAPTD